MHVDGAGLTSTALAISRLVRPTETRWGTSNSSRDNPGFEPASRPKRRRVEWSSRRTFRRPGRRRPAATDSPPHLAVNVMRSASDKPTGCWFESQLGGALRGAQPATRFAVLAPFIPSRSSRKVFAHFSMSFSKT